MRAAFRLALIACLAAPASAQFSLYLVNGGVEQPAPAVLDLGGVYPTETASALFRIRNTSAQPASLDLLQARGPGFAVTGAPALPAGLDPQRSFDFAVVFQATATGSYSASLDTVGASVLLTARVLPSLTVQVQTPAGAQTLGAAGVDFGSVQAGGSVARHFTLTNFTGFVLTAPGIAVQGGAFTLASPPPAGKVFQPGDSAGFDIVFQPAAAGAASGALAIGDRTYPLAGSGLPVPLPHPALAMQLAQAQSGQNGTVSVGFDAPAQTSGTGVLTLDFQPLAQGATDPAIQLGIAGRSISFPVAAGDSQANFGGQATVNFQTGTTAGKLVFTASLGGATDQKSVVIPAAPVSIAAASGKRGAGSLELDITGYDNTRSIGTVVYTFYDAAGNALGAPIQVDNTADFAAFFASSNDGGNFLLRAVFPVSGDASRIAAFEVQLTNSAGMADTGRVKF